MYFILIVSSVSWDEENQLSEDKANELLDTWLQADGWKTEIACEWQHGIDIEALCFCSIRQGRHVTCCRVSGKEVALLTLPPLRTVRESFVIDRIFPDLQAKGALPLPTELLPATRASPTLDWFT